MGRKHSSSEHERERGRRSLGERQAAPSGRDSEVNPYSEGSGNHGRLLSKVAARRSCLHFLRPHRAARGEEM